MGRGQNSYTIREYTRVRVYTCGRAGGGGEGLAAGAEITIPAVLVYQPGRPAFARERARARRL